jgi:hypothetical protein
VVLALVSLYIAAMSLLIWLRPEASRSPKTKGRPAADSAPAPKNLLPVKLFLWLWLKLFIAEPVEYYAPLTT